MAADKNSKYDEIDAKEKSINTAIRVLNIIFYTLVFACFIVGEYYYLNSASLAY
jgi:IS4 transposase